MGSLCPNTFPCKGLLHNEVSFIVLSTESTKK